MERLKDPNRPAFQSPWQDVVLVWRVLRVLVARLDLGGIGPLMVRALGLTRGQRRGETVEEYFQAKRELLMEGDAYGDMIATYLAYWSGLRRLEPVILMDARVLGRIWPGQIMGRDPQIEGWAADTAPDVGALQQLLSNLDNRPAVWSQIQAFPGSGS